MSALLEVDGLVKHFPARRGGIVHAVDGVSFSVAAGETLGVVGESGSGKSTVARLVLRLLEPTAGVIRVDGADIGHANRRSLRAIRRRVQIVFQDPYSSLDPRMSAARSSPNRCGSRVGARKSGRGCPRCSAWSGSDRSTSRAFRTSCRAVNGNASASRGRWRSNPELLVLDEPVSALDGSIQAQILNLLVDLQERLGLAYLFIAHDLAVVRHVADRIAVMHLGQIVETGTAAQLFDVPGASVHAGVALGIAGAGSRGGTGASTHRAARRAPERAGPAVGMPLPDPLLEGHGRVRGATNPISWTAVTATRWRASSPTHPRPNPRASRS